MITKRTLENTCWKLYWMYGGLFSIQEPTDEKDLEIFKVCDYKIRMTRYYPCRNGEKYITLFV